MKTKNMPKFLMVSNVLLLTIFLGSCGNSNNVEVENSKEKVIEDIVEVNTINNEEKEIVEEATIMEENTTINKETDLIEETKSTTPKAESTPTPDPEPKPEPVAVNSTGGWVVPAKFKSAKNPTQLDISSAKTLWNKHCKSCHGKTGGGDGPKAEELDTEMENFSSAKIQNQSDGSLFYKTIEGRDDMPSFKKKIRDENDIWNLVNYIRTFK
jgi:mono/diheme cytochrome c family protein